MFQYMISEHFSYALPMSQLHKVHIRWAIQFSWATLQAWEPLIHSSIITSMAVSSLAGAKGVPLKWVSERLTHPLDQTLFSLALQSRLDISLFAGNILLVDWKRQMTLNSALSKDIAFTTTSLSLQQQTHWCLCLQTIIILGLYWMFAHFSRWSADFYGFRLWVSLI